MKFEELSTKCRIEYKVITEDPTYGTDIVAWRLLGVRWCHLQDVMPSRSESTTDNLVIAKNPTRCRLNYCTDIRSTMRVTVNRPDPITYNIISGPAILGDKERVEIMLEEVSS